MNEAVQHIEFYFRNDPAPQDFEDIMGYQLGSGFFAVMTREGKTFIYPQDLIEKVILTQVEKE
jgi:uncharacterized protein YrrD